MTWRGCAGRSSSSQGSVQANSAAGSFHRHCHWCIAALSAQSGAPAVHVGCSSHCHVSRALAHIGIHNGTPCLPG